MKLVSRAVCLLLVLCGASASQHPGQRSAATGPSTRTITVVTEPKAIIWIDEIRRGVTDDGGRLTSLVGNLAVRQAEFFARTLWKGKVFSSSQRIARTRIDDPPILAPLLKGSTSGSETTIAVARQA